MIRSDVVVNEWVNRLWSTLLLLYPMPEGKEIINDFDLYVVESVIVRVLFSTKMSSLPPKYQIEMRGDILATYSAIKGCS